MIKIKLEDVVIPEHRFRRTFDEKKLNELRDSILRNGLLHPITVEKRTDELLGDQWILRAGERRYKVIANILKDGKSFFVGAQLFSGDEIPVNNYDELTPLQRLEIEVEENVIRSDFAWQERIAALAALHELRKKQDPGQTLSATASEVLGKPAEGNQISVVSDALIINKHLHMPEVAKAKTAKDALKIIEKIATAGHRAKLAASASVSANHNLIKGDSLDVLPTLPAASFDVILTDPPYGVDADKFGEMASTGHDYGDSKKWFEESFLKKFPDESFRVTKERAHCYIFCDVRNFEKLSLFMLLAGWTCFPTPLIWAKSGGMLPFPDNGPRRTYECIFYAWKGDRKTLVVKTDVIDISSVKNLKHGAQKPVALYCDLLSRSANPGDVVLDAFGGTGTILVAANRLRLTATYIENNETSFNIAKLRQDVQEIDDDAVENDGLADIPLR